MVSRSALVVNGPPRTAVGTAAVNASGRLLKAGCANRDWLLSLPFLASSRCALLLPRVVLLRCGLTQSC